MISLRRKICVVTGTRAEYGLLFNLMKEIQKDDYLELQVVATGMHLSPEFGLTYKQIEEDGFIIHEKVEMLLSSDTHVGIVKSIGLATIGFADVFERLQPDVIVILGDRFEMLAVGQVALIMRIPIAHIHGGELSFGAYDDAIRHSLTKMATWHFTSTQSHRNRVIQLGEDPSRVWNVGALGIENIVNKKFLSREESFAKIGIDVSKPLFLITLHPETNGDSTNIYELFSALGQFPDYQIVFTKSNADNGGRKINAEIEAFVAEHSNAYVFDSLGYELYLNVAKHAAVVIGNSSSGLIEIPYLNVPTVNIGNRQRGRQRPLSVFQSESNQDLIVNTIQDAILFEGPYEYIFGEGNASKEIARKLSILNLQNIQKEFYDL